MRAGAALHGPGRGAAARRLIDQGLYFVVHAPRQTGKTTTLTALANDLSAGGDRVAILVSCETAQEWGFRGCGADMIDDGTDLSPPLKRLLRH